MLDFILLLQHDTAVKLTFLNHGPVQLRLGSKTLIEVSMRSLEGFISLIDLHIDRLVQGTDTARS